MPSWALHRDGTLYRVLTDQVGSVHAVVNAATGAVVQRYTYSPYGVLETALTTREIVPHRFAGGLHDDLTHLLRFGARDYDPEIGCWTARDPILFAGGQANLYAYVGGDPINLVDPSGLIAPLVFAAWFVIAGGVGYTIGSIAGEHSIGHLDIGGDGPIPHAERGWGPFGVNRGTPPRWHNNRNANQTCPDTLAGCGGSSWTRDDQGAHDASTYRGAGSENAGAQCSYDDAGELSRDPVRQGSFDYSPPGDSLVGHMFDDVVPVFMYGTGNQGPDRRFVDGPSY